MKKFSRIVLGLTVLALVFSPVLAADPTIKEVMKKAHAGMESLLAGIEKNVKGDKPDWDVVGKNTKEMSDLSKFLVKYDPPKGEKASWEKQCKIYEEQVATLVTATGKKDKEATAAAAATIRKGCGACHGPHKPK